MYLPLIFLMKKIVLLPGLSLQCLLKKDLELESKSLQCLFISLTLNGSFNIRFETAVLIVS